MDKTKRKRNAIHSGIGDQDDLLVKAPVQEDAIEDFSYAARLRGKKRHEAMIYPELPFQYGVTYKGQTKETYNEKGYRVDINAHPEKNIAYRIEQKKELPYKRLWEAQACYEAEVLRHNLKYAVNYRGHVGKEDKRTAEYAVNWSAFYTLQDLGDLKDYCTTSRGIGLGNVGYGNWTTQSGYIEDKTNTDYWSGVIARGHENLTSADVTFSFKPITSTTQSAQGVMRRVGNTFRNQPGWDDDVIGFIFRAKDEKNFYMLLWEAEERLWKNSRAPANMDGLRITTRPGETTFFDRQVQENSAPPNNVEPTASVWNEFVNNAGWKKQHRRLYQVKDGYMKRLDKNAPGRPGGPEGSLAGVYDKGSGRGWEMLQPSAVKVEMAGKRCVVSVKETSTSSFVPIYSFESEWDHGSFGVLNISQAVQFNQVSVIQKQNINGRIPETGYNTLTEGTKRLSSNASDYVKASDSWKNAVHKAGVTPGYVYLMSIDGELKNPDNGSITVSGMTGPITVSAKDNSTRKDFSGRIPATGWMEFNGIGDLTVASSAEVYIREKAGKSDLIIDSISGEVANPADGSVVVSAASGPIIARNANPPDAGKVYDKCYIRCGIVEITPDYRSYDTGLLVFGNIADVFKNDYAEFFNRPDYINKKETYELLQPVPKDPPKPPPPKEESQAGCVVEEEEPEPEEEVDQKCLNEFDYDGKKLVMWGCEFPLDIKTKLFEDKVFAYQGWMEFDPLSTFDPNKWTTYTLMPIEGTINPLFDEIRWKNRTELADAPVGSKVLIRTTEWYKAIFPADIENSGIVTSDKNIIMEIPPAPEHFVSPTDKDSRMPGTFDTIHFLLDSWQNHPDVVIWFKSDDSKTTENAGKDSSNLAYEGRFGMPILFTEKDNDQIIIHCKEDPRFTPWSSGKYIGYGKVNGKRPFYGDGAGKANMVDVPTDTVFFPENLVMETLKGPFIEVYDKESPDFSRVQYHLHSDGKKVDFSSEHTDAFIWYTDWYSKWVKNETVYKAMANDTLKIDTPLDLDPTNPEVSIDYDPDDTVIEKIEVSGNNPFVKLWIEEDEGKRTGLLGTYYRYPLTSNIYKEKWQATAPQVENGFTLEKKLGSFIEVFVEGVLLDKAFYTFDKRTLVIQKGKVETGNWVHIQSFETSGFHDPTQKNYLGEKQYSQMDFQEDVPSNPSNPNYQDMHYEGSFCFNWGYDRPKRMTASATKVLSVNALTNEPSIPDLNPPKESNPNDGFTISWNGYIFAPVSGTYRFKATVNDGFRLWIRDTEIINEWHATGNPDYFPDYEASIYLEGGKWHSIRANYFDNKGQALVRLHWAMPGKSFQRISPDYLTPYLGYKLFAQVKKARPLEWNPLLHNGYYYHQDKEHYLYAEKTVQKKTPNDLNQIFLTPRPQQGSPIIVRDNKGNNLRKVTFYNDDWNLTLENKEVFNGSGFSKYYLQYKGIDEATVKVKLNGVTLMKQDYIFRVDESSIEFMRKLTDEDELEIRYILLYSYYLDMNSDLVDGLINKDEAKIVLHSNYDKNLMKNMEIVYEASKKTPFYKASEIPFNPILNHNHTGFLYITEKTEQQVKDVMVHLSDKMLSNSGMEKVLLTVKVVDQYGNPCPNKPVEIWRDDVLQIPNAETNEVGEVYFYDTPKPTDSLVSIYKVKCDSFIQEILLNYYEDNHKERYYLEMNVQKFSIMAGLDDESVIKVTLRDQSWNPVGKGKPIQVMVRTTQDAEETSTLFTDDYGQVTIRLNGKREQHGNLMLKVSYDMGFEEAASYEHIRVIGG